MCVFRAEFKVILTWYLLWGKMSFTSPVINSVDIYPTDDDRRMLQWIRSPNFLQMEFFTMASGNYLAFPTDAGAEDELTFYTISKSVSELWTQLSAMEKVDETIIAVTQEMSSMFRDLNVYRNAINFICQKVDSILIRDPTLGPKYVNMKNNLNYSTVRPAERKIYFWNTLDDIASLSAKKMEAWLSNQQIRKLLLNGDFLFYTKRPLNHFTGDEEGKYDRDFRLTAMSILKMSKDPQLADNVQKLYDEALIETINEINSDLDFRHPKFRLFEKLATKFQVDDVLNGKLTLIKTEINATIV